MRFANPDVLEILISRELSTFMPHLTRICQVICFAMDNAVTHKMNKKSLDLFKQTILMSLSGLEFSLQDIFLNRIKKFINSADFNPPGNVTTTHYLKFSIFDDPLFSITRKTNFLKPMESCLDELIKNNLKASEAKESKEVKENTSTTSTSACAQVTAFIFLLLSLPFSTAARTYPAYNQSPNLPAPHPMDSDMGIGTCLPVHELPLLYHIIHNVPLEEVTHFFLGENHDNETHIELREKTTINLGAKQVRIEGARYTKEIACDEINLPKTLHCRGWEDPDLLDWIKTNVHPFIQAQKEFSDEFYQLIYYLDTQIDLLNKETKIMTLKNILQTMFFETDKIIEKHNLFHEKLFKKEQNNYQKIKKAIRNIKTKEEAIDLIHDLQDSLNKLSSNFITLIDNKLKPIAPDSLMVAKRNHIGLEHEIMTLEKANQQRIKHRNKPITQIYYAGGAHLFSRRGLIKPHSGAFIINPDLIHSIASDDPQYSFRVAASKVPSAILYPR